MNAFKKYFQKLVELGAGDQYLDRFEEAFDRNYKGEGDPESDAAFDAFNEVKQDMYCEGNLSEDFV